MLAAAGLVVIGAIVIVLLLFLDSYMPHWGRSSVSQHRPVQLAIDWTAVARVSKTTATLQVVVNPLLRPGSPIHDNVFSELKDLRADYARFVPWFPYPRLGVAELEPPAHGRTSWDFRRIDPIVLDFLRATRGHPQILNFSTIPQWMWKTPSAVPVPADPDVIDFRYLRGTRLRVPIRTVAAYFRRLVSWYAAGGFRDEYGHFHRSGHHYKIKYWEVLNEMEHSLSPRVYTKLYDAIVPAIQSVSPHTRFIGLALAADVPAYFTYFLGRAKHRPNIPLDFISYHFYGGPASDETPDTWGSDTFAQANGFISKVRYVETIRKRLSPKTRTTVDEVGTILSQARTQPKPARIPDVYWNYSGALFAYVFAQLALEGIDVVGESQLVAYPGQYPSVSMVDWNTGKPNARYRVLQLLRENIPLGSRLAPPVITPGAEAGGDLFYALALHTPSRKRKLLLINKRNFKIPVWFPGLKGATAKVVDEVSAGGPPREEVLTKDEYVIPEYGVAILTLSG